MRLFASFKLSENKTLTNMNFKTSKTIAQQIADRLCDEILRGRYPEEERIPSVREYAAQMEVNVNTLVRSYEHLQQAGIIYQKRGVGYYVCTGASERILAERRTSFIEHEATDFFRQMDMLRLSIDDINELYGKYRSC